MVFTNTISRSLKTFLQIELAWPGVRYVVVRRIIYMSSLIIVQYFQYMYLFAHFNFDELQDLMENLTTTVNYSLTVIKLMTLWTNSRLLRELVADMDTDWRECVNDQHLRLMTTKANTAHFFSNALFSFNTLAGTIYFLGSNVIAIIGLSEESNDTTRPLPLKLLLPFDTDQSPIYELLVVGLFVLAMFHVYALTITNVLLFTLVFHASGQIDIMCHELKAIAQEIPFNRSSKNTMGTLIGKHNKVITFSENIDKFFSFVTLTQILLNTLVICAVGFLFITSDRQIGIDMLKNLCAYIAITGEIFLFCFIGEYLSIKSKLLADAAYNSLWYNMTPNQNKNLIFVIMRSQKQLTIKARGMMNLSLEGFTNIMKASASYISVLYTMY